MSTGRSLAELHWKSAHFLILSKTRFNAEVGERRFLSLYAIIDYVFNGGVGVELRAAGAAGVDPIAEEGSGRGCGFRRRHDRCPVWRRFGQCAHKTDEVCVGHISDPGVDCRADEFEAVSFGRVGSSQSARDIALGWNYSRPSNPRETQQPLYNAQPDKHKPDDDDSGRRHKRHKRRSDSNHKRTHAEITA